MKFLYQFHIDNISEMVKKPPTDFWLRLHLLALFLSEVEAHVPFLASESRMILETFFLNLFHGGRLKAMPPKLVSDDGRHMVIRPLAYCKEPDLEKYAKLKYFPIIPCNLCGAQQHLQRQVVKEMMRDWDKRFPGRLETMFASLQRVSPSHLFDADLFDFRGLETRDGTFADGDIGFDSEEYSAKLIPLVIGRKVAQK